MIEDLALEPVGREFDLVALRAYLESMATVIRDPVDPNRYLMASDSRTRRDGLAKRLGNPAKIPYTLTAIVPTPTCILIGMRGTDPEPVRAFVQWLRDNQDIRILDQDFNDFTEEASENLDFVFGPSENK
jgi:hypothetical protein